MHLTKWDQGWDAVCTDCVNYNKDTKYCKEHDEYYEDVAEGNGCADHMTLEALNYHATGGSNNENNRQKH